MKNSLASEDSDYSFDGLNLGFLPLVVNHNMKTMLKYPLILMLLTATLIFAQSGIHSTAIESTVLLEFIVGNVTHYGSGVFFQNSDNKVFIITACHVLSNPTNVEFTLYGPKLQITIFGDIYKSDESKVEIDLDNLYKNGLLKYDKEKDVAIIQFGNWSNTNGVRVLPQANIQGLKRSIHPKITGALYNQLGAFTNLLLGSDVYIIGYPKSLGISSRPQYNFNVPLLRKGIIAGIYEEKKTFIIDAPGYNGNSGGPVFQITDSTKLIGIVSQRIPYVKAIPNNITITNVLTLSNNTTLTNNITVTNTIVVDENSGYSVAVPIENAIRLMK
jgi:S1-C subfamily serine protease